MSARVDNWLAAEARVSCPVRAELSAEERRALRTLHAEARDAGARLKSPLGVTPSRALHAFRRASYVCSCHGQSHGLQLVGESVVCQEKS